MDFPFLVLAALFAIYYFLVKFLNLLDKAMPPKLYFSESKFNRNLLDACKILTEPYVPNCLWGRSGHIQSFIYAKVGRFNAPHPKGTRKHKTRPDGATVTFDIFEPLSPHPAGADLTICIAPGIANHSEKAYVRTFVHHAISHGFRVAVLNHLGALETVPLTSPRIFTYGETGEYASMVDDVIEEYPGTKLISIGFSMGANIVIKYLGEEPSRQEHFICCVSICQGYDITLASTVLHEWENMRRFYNFMITQNMLRQLRRNKDMLFGDGAKSYWESKGEAPPCYNVDKVFNATSLLHLDEELTRKMCRHNNLIDFYRECSSCEYILQIKVPTLLLNTEDDALIPVQQNVAPLEFSRKSPCAIYAVTKHGGHLGFFEGGFLKANPISWMDRALISYMNTVLDLSPDSPLSQGDTVSSNGFIS